MLGSCYEVEVKVEEENLYEHLRSALSLRWKPYDEVDTPLNAVELKKIASDMG